MDGVLSISSPSSSFSLKTIPIIQSPIHSRKPLQLLPRKIRRQFPLPLALSSSSAPVSTTTREAEIELENRKFELLTAVNDTKRGLTVDPAQRSSIEEALVNVESFEPGQPIDLDLLNGTWRLQYTSASDVLILFQSAATLPFFEVDQIYQKFECGKQSSQGIVRNVVRWSIPRLLEDREGATLVVSAKFSVVSARNIYLEFEEIAVQNINISEELQAVIAPALLPRSFLSLQILQFIKSFKAQVPVSSSERRSVGGLYYLSYLDNNMLVGRAIGGGGSFVFTKAPALTWL